MKTIKLFLASAGALHEERTQLELLVSRENKALLPQGIYLDFVVWEQQSLAFANGPKQDDFTNSMLDSEIVICLVFDKIGPFTYEEFKKAYEGFSNGRNPKKLYVYLKNVPIMSLEIPNDFQRVIDFKNEIKSYKQVFGTYSTVHELWTQVKHNLEIDLPGLSKKDAREEMVSLLNKINPVIHNHFIGGGTEIGVMIAPMNLAKLEEFVAQHQSEALLSMRSTGSIIMASPGSTIGGHINDLAGGSMLHGFVLTKLQNYPAL